MTRFIQRSRHQILNGDLVTSFTVDPPIKTGFGYSDAVPGHDLGQSSWIRGKPNLPCPERYQAPVQRDTKTRIPAQIHVFELPQVADPNQQSCTQTMSCE